MNFQISVNKFAETALAKRGHLMRDPLGFFALSMMAGAYVGLGILLIFSVGQGVDASIRPIVMGASFGLALLLVVFAGAELFTGHTMYMTFGVLTNRTTWGDLAYCWCASWPDPFLTDWARSGTNYASAQWVRGGEFASVFVCGCAARDSGRDYRIDFCRPVDIRGYHLRCCRR